MRRDVFIENDSGGFSVLAGAAVDAILEDARQDDVHFVTSHRALLLELYGDDSMPVRVVVDEPLRPEEEAQWLARASWRIDAPDGRLLVMGGFDPDVLGDWRDEHGPDADGGGVAVIEAAPGSWRVDVYAHVGSMNGRQILFECGEEPGAFFRRCHPGRPFPVWLAKMLEFSGDGDPGHEELWKDVAASVKEGRLSVDTERPSAVGFLVHVTRFSGPLPEPPEAGWFDREAGKRVPGVFPCGLPADVPDPDLSGFLDRLLSRPRPKTELPVATGLVEIIESWSGDPLKRFDAGGERALVPTDAFLLYWMAALCSDSPPRFELWVTPGGPWTPPTPSPECAVVQKAAGKIWALGPPPSAGGWLLWACARRAAEGLAGVPDGSTLDLAMARRDTENEDVDPTVGRALYSGLVKAGAWQVSEASPAVTREALDAALAFVAELAGPGRISVRGDAERRALDDAAALYSPEKGSLLWEGESVRPEDGDERTLLMLAAPVFRTRFGAQWRCDPLEADEEG